MESKTEFGKNRFSIRLYSFAWAILETRDKEFDAEDTKNQNWIVTILKAMGDSSRGCGACGLSGRLLLASRAT